MTHCPELSPKGTHLHLLLQNTKGQLTPPKHITADDVLCLFLLFRSLGARELSFQSPLPEEVHICVSTVIKQSPTYGLVLVSVFLNILSAMWTMVLVIAAEKEL